MGKDHKANGGMATTREAENLSQPTFSETVSGGTVCRKAARTGLWGERGRNEPLYPEPVYKRFDRNQKD
ncbi:hypothetical protein A4R26_04670 [Niastella populi]|uniref:Uncharacterized protein n=1 Tax=Niastella populi TaxID=550983 RepID=A0A1V9FDK7_9BACT|nr:hypothetical protein A4R26_04670 [Niastella populi]